MNDQKKKYGKQINIVTTKVGAGDSAEELKKAKLKTHGIIAKDKSGKLVTTVEGHSYGEKKVVEVLSKLLKKK